MNDYSVKNYKEKIDSAKTFEELADVGVEIIKQISLSGKPIIQVCGPLSTGGFSDHMKNLDYMEEAIQIAIKKGYLVFDQTPFDNAMKKLSEKYPKTDNFDPILETFYGRVFKTGLMSKFLFLPDWQNSKGSVWERNMATKLNIKAEDYPKAWLSEIDKI